MDKLSSQISSEVDLKAHIASYPELYEDLAVDALEERLEMDCLINYCGAHEVEDPCVGYCPGLCAVDICAPNEACSINS